MMRQVAAQSLAMSCLAIFPSAPAVAQPQGDRAAFDTCVAEIWEEESGNFLAAAVIPSICGERHFRIRQSCSRLGYITPTGMQDCLSDDLALWRDEMLRLEAAALAEGLGGRGDLFDSGMDRCVADTNEGSIPRLDCEGEVHWREVMGFYAAPLMTSGAATAGGKE